ncbi:MAG TPA: outer membrane beta-barrel protein [Kofleriaceae bacterium]|nr:outer membrane beta-barrel protein [Kofleriaceae bacterium]
MRTALAAASTLAAVALSCLPGLAEARPFTAGVGVGRSQAKADAEGDASDTLQLFGRFSFTKRLSAQLEIQKLQLPYGDVTVRSGTLLLVVDLGQRGHLVPILMAGFGGASATDDYGYETSASHTEGGAGLEYRADGGLTIGVDLRIGGRSLDDDDVKIQPATTDVIAIYPYNSLQAGEYRSARLYAAVRF